MSRVVEGVLSEIGRGHALSEESAYAFMNELMNGKVSSVQTGAILAAMAVRGETVDEIVGFARAMREHSRVIRGVEGCVDTCGTGGDGADTFNISTTAAFVCAAAGVPVAKHGNRAVSSRSGSADVLQALGAKIDLSEQSALQCLHDTGITFLFAPQFHPAMKHAAEPRKQLGFRTIFNILGPLTNPARTRRQVVGVYRQRLVPLVAEAVLRLGIDHVVVVHGHGGLDELSLSGETKVAEVHKECIREYTVTPGEFGISEAPLGAVRGGDAMENAKVLREVLQGSLGPARDIVALNAGAAIYVAGRVPSIVAGVTLANNLIDSGKAYACMEQYIAASNRLAVQEVAL